MSLLGDVHLAHRRVSESAHRVTVERDDKNTEVLGKNVTFKRSQDSFFLSSVEMQLREAALSAL